MHLIGMDMFDMRNGIVILRKDADRHVTSAHDALLQMSASS